MTAGRYGRIVGFFGGWWNYLGWTVAFASGVQITSLMVTSMYAIYHPDLTVQTWHVFVTYMIQVCILFSVAIWWNRILPSIELIGGVLTVLFCIITIIICVVLRGRGDPAANATDAFVWRDWQNLTGWTSDGFIFLLGMLNGAFTMGTPDIITHLAEEVPRYAL